MDVLSEIKNTLDDALESSGATLKESREEVAQFMHDRALHLSTITHEPGFGKAVVAERNAIAMEAGLEVSEVAGKADVEMLGWIGAGLRIFAMVLA